MTTKVLVFLVVLPMSLASQCGTEEPPHYPRYASYKNGDELIFPYHATNATLRWISDGKVEGQVDIDLLNDESVTRERTSYKIRYLVDRSKVPQNKHTILCYNVAIWELDESGEDKEKACTRCTLLMMCCQTDRTTFHTRITGTDKIQFNVAQLPVPVVYVRGYRVEEVATVLGCENQIHQPTEAVSVLQSKDRDGLEWFALHTNSVTHAKLRTNNVHRHVAFRASFDLKFELEDGEIVLIKNFMSITTEPRCKLIQK